MIVRVVFGLLFGISVVLVAAFVLGEPAGAYNATHEVYPTMRQVDPAVERSTLELWIGWVFGAAQIALFVALMALGSWKHVRGSGLGRWLFVSAAGYLLVWTILFLAYLRYRDGMEPGLVFALPHPTAIMLYVLWPLPLAFILLYTLGFRRWIFTPTDERAFQRLLARYRSRQHGE